MTSASTMVGGMGGIMSVPDGMSVPEEHMAPTNGYHGDGVYRQQGEYGASKHVVVDGGDRFCASAVVFDAEEELLWMGNQGGHVTSYYGHDLQKYTSFQVHENATETRQLQSMGDNMLCLFSDSLRCWSKFGRRMFVHTFTSVLDAQCMLKTDDSQLLLGGHQPLLMEVDFNTCQELRQIDITANDSTILRQSNQYICSGDTTGKVTLRDPQSLKGEHELQAHSGTLSDMDVHGNQLYTCGFANRMGALHVDRFLMVYDLRTMRALPPMQVNLEPMFIRCVPALSKICMVSQNGQFQVMDQGALTPESMIMYQVENEGAPILSFDASSSHSALAFGDSGGYLHLFTKGETATFNQFSKQTEFPHMEPAHPPISITDVLTPYSVIPMVYPSGGIKLSSDWPEELCKAVYRKPLKIDLEILRTSKLVHNVGYAPNPGTRRRNQCMYKLDGDGPTTYSERQMAGTVPDSPMGRGEDPWVSIPKQYSKVEIKYSKLGVEDFDFRHYNKTNFAGLETHIPNAYCNAMLQVLYFIEPLRAAMLSHLCRKEFCLACELGFLFHMLDLQKGKTCQASNFLRAFRTIPEAAALGLVLNDHEESMGKVNLPRLIQNWSRFIMQQIHTELVEAERNKNCPQSPFEVLRAPAFTKHDTSGEGSPPSGGDDSGDSGDSGDGGSADKDDTKAEVPSFPLGKMPESPGIEAELEKDLQHDEPDAPNSIITEVFGCELENIFKCRCGNVQSRSMTSSVVDLNYQEGSPREKAQIIPSYTFGQMVQRSVCQEQQTQAWCPSCEKYQPHTQTRDIKTIPEVLALNCHLESVRDFEFWRAQEEYARIQDTADSSVASNISAISYSSRTSLKMCRYGKGCTRKDCKFRHEGDFAREKVDMAERSKELSHNAWVPYALKWTLSSEGKVTVEDIRNEVKEDIPEENLEPNVMYFQLLATVAHIDDHRTCGNLIANVKVGESYHRRKEGVTCNQWYLINDFSISPIEQQEAVHFSLDWKVPCVIFFNRIDISAKYMDTVTNPITVDSLLRNKSLVETPRRRSMTFTPLGDDELPGAGAIIGLDAEFVTLNQEEAELRSDGTQSTLKPSQLSVARVSCVRGWRELLYGEPFMDDYISTQEQVVDYLTQFSGIKPGDLDAAVSSKHLASLKSTYMKLRYLVDVGAIFVGHGLKKDFRVINLVVRRLKTSIKSAKKGEGEIDAWEELKLVGGGGGTYMKLRYLVDVGAIFVGHGLKKDFRVINLVVPKEQIIDTVELFHLPRQRMISLRFLAWYFLDLRIQTATHDSIEDAKTALLLYKKYQELSGGNKEKVRPVLKEMYEQGRALRWKVPPEKGEQEDKVADETVESELQEIM